jgi:regulator of replication initiation timing
MKLTYKQLEKSRNNWKSIAEAATMYLKVINGGDADRNLLISEIAKLSEWNAKHIEENDKLKLEIAELEQALTGRTVSCIWCNGTMKERDKAIKERDDAIQERDEVRDVLITLYSKLAAGLEGKEKQATTKPVDDDTN